MMGIARSSKVVFSKYQKQAFINQAGNREWASLIEAIGNAGRQLPLFVILKDKKWKDDWYPSDMVQSARISPSENGWTDNKLCMEWIRNCFEPKTRSYLPDEYRVLIVDGYTSHISTGFIQFALENPIVGLCLPAYSTHLLQPLDVGVFGPLKQNHKTLLAEKTQFTTYNIDKADFISLIQKARQHGTPLEIYNQYGKLQDLFHTIPPPSLIRYQLVIRTLVFQLALLHPSEHVFPQAKYHQHQEIVNKSQRWRSLYPYFAIRLLILLSLPSYIKLSKQLGL